MSVKRTPKLAIASLFILVQAACGGCDNPPPAADASSDASPAPLDAATQDTGAQDTSPADAAPLDSHRADGSAPVDAGIQDASDASLPLLDAAGLTDSGQDTGMIDDAAATDLGDPRDAAPGLDATDAAGPRLPPDPASVATPVVPAVPQTFADLNAFLYEGGDPVQRGVDATAMEANRLAILRGLVLADDGAPLPGVSVSVFHHPEFGWTLSRADGRFDLAVNGGALVRVNYAGPGLLPVQRSIKTNWNAYYELPEVVMIALDPVATPIDFGAASPQQVRGSEVSDDDGTRQPTLLVPSGVEATIVAADGSSQPVSHLTLRATEYTVGPLGPARMPAPLPANSAYTHAVELSADELLGREGASVVFSRPIPYYVENFLGFAVGEAVPAGFYDRDCGCWRPSDNGRVIEILDITQGQAEVDVDGDGQADSGATLSALGIDEEELTELAGLYAVGQSLWRTPIPHLTPWDCNWPEGPPEGSEPPQNRPPGNDQDDDPCRRSGSIIGCQSQSLDEVIDIPGSPYSLRYSSQRQPGYRGDNNKLFTVSGADLPPTPPKSIELSVSIAGRFESWVFPASPSLEHLFQWDGRDAYGRDLRGEQHGIATVTFRYDSQYYESNAAFEQSFAQMGTARAIPLIARSEVLLQRSYRFTLGKLPAPTGATVGGWTFAQHRVYNPLSGTLYQGDGIRRRYSLAVIDTVLEQTRASGLAVGADGSLFFAADYRIWRRMPDGSQSAIAGTGQRGSDGNGGPALLARINPGPLALGPAGDLYFVDYGGSIRRVDAAGLVHAVAGGASGSGYAGDEGPAVDAQINAPSGLVVDPEGSVYFTSQFNHCLRKVDPNGIIHTIAGGNGRGTSGDGGPATEARLSYPSGLAIGADGSLYFTDKRNTLVRKIDPSGEISTVAGNGANGFEIFGVAATATPVLAKGLALGSDGSLYISANGLSRQGSLRQWHNIIRRVRANGIMELFAGNTETSGDGGDGGPAAGAEFSAPDIIAFGPDGTLYVADSGNNMIRKISPAQNTAQGAAYLVPSLDGAEVYEFDLQGRHLATRDALTARVLHSFTYDASGALVGLTDRYGRSTVIERDASGAATAIVAPTGQRTELSVNAEGYLASLTQPSGESMSFTYAEGGLLSSLTDYAGQSARFTYDSAGRLIRDKQRGGGLIELSRSPLPGGFAVQVRDALGSMTQYENQRLDDGSLRRRKTTAAGALTESVLTQDQTQTLLLPDGMQVVFAQDPDPRWGVLLLQPSRVTTTSPAGLQQNLSITRDLVLSDPADLTSLSSLQESVDMNGSVFTRHYDATARTVTLTSATGWSETRHYDIKGRLLSVSADGMASLDVSYDGDGRLSAVQADDLIKRRRFDSQGRLVGVENALTEARDYSYDLDGRLSGSTLPGGETLGLAYDANGKLSRLDLPSGASYSFDYDANQQRSAIHMPGGAEHLIDRQLDGRVSRWQLPTGRAIERFFDAAGRFIGHSYNEASLDVRYLDATLRPARLDWTPASGSPQSLSYAYDGALIVGQSWSGPASASYTYRHNKAFEVVGVSLNGGAERSLVRDADGRIIGDGNFGFTRAGPMGRVSAISDSLMHLSQTYDLLGRMSTRSLSVAGQSIYDLNLSYDAAGRRLGDDESVLGGPVVARRYSYDASGQLLQVSQGASITESHGYDANGNRVSHNEGSGPQISSYDAQDRITQLGATSYQLDADGMLAQRGGDTFSYSARGELMQATVGGSTVSYGYDGLGRRVYRSVGAQNEFYYYGDPERDLVLTASQSSDGTWTEYFYDDASQLYALRRSGQWYYVGSDALGSPRVVVDALGQRVKEIRYSAFGAVLADSDPGFELAVGFAGGLRDSLTGLVNFWRRDYDSAAGRFTARDPIDFSSGQYNLYAYAGNNPLTRRDPTGLFSMGVGFYEGAGGDMTLHWTRDGWALCANAGFGAGVSFSFNPFSDELPEDSTLEISLSAGGSFMGSGGHVSGGWGLVFCPDGRQVWAWREEFGARTALSEYSSDSLDGQAEWQGYNPGIDSGFGASLTAGNCHTYAY